MKALRFILGLSAGFGLWLIVLSVGPVSAATAIPTSTPATTPTPIVASPQPFAVNIYLFWGEGCPHCAKAKPVLADMDTQSTFVNLYQYEVYYNTTNQERLAKVADKLKITASGVPVIIVGDQATVGYSEAVAEDISERVAYCQANNCPDRVAGLVGAPAPTSSQPLESGTGSNGSTTDVIRVPWLGDIHPHDVSLPVLTIIIAGLDGFNPCAMWVLLFLISLLLGMKNRGKMWALGGTFILSSAVVYFGFLAAWLNIFLFLGYISWLKIAIGLVALAAGGYYLYDGLKHRGACAVSNNGQRQRYFARLRSIAANQRLWVSLGGIALLAVAVNLVEMVCSAGLPAIYTHILTAAGLPVWQYYAYLLLYILVFMADDLFVFFMAMFTLKMVGIEHKFALASRLIGAIVMLVLGVLLIFAPSWLMFG